jgi:apolipoprotein N-acyltransferase
MGTPLRGWPLVPDHPFRAGPRPVGAKGERVMRRVTTATIAVLSSAAAYFLVCGAHPVWPLAWIAPAPLLAFAFGAPARRAGAAAFLGYGLGSLAVLQYTVGVMPVAVAGVFVIAGATAFAVIVLLTRRAVLRLDRWMAVFVFPILWTAWEYLLSALGTTAHLAYSQADVASLVQVAAFTGSWGVTFLVSLLPSALAVAWWLRGRRTQCLAALGIPLALCGVAVAWGAVRLTQPATGPVVRVGLAASDAMVRFFRTENAEEALAVIAAYAQRIAALAARGAQVVVLPEKFVGVTPAYAEAARDALGQAARAHHLWLVAGLNRIETPARRNVALVFDPEGRMVLEYQKVHLVPGYEDGYGVGRAPAPLATPQGTWGVAICRDLSFSDVGRANSRAGVGLLLVPAWDFVRDANLMARMAALRSVEGGFAVARAAQEGLVSVSDARGRILGAAATADAPEALLVVDVPTGPGRTFYARTGAWFALLISGLAAGIALALGVEFRRSRRADRARTQG